MPAPARRGRRRLPRDLHPVAWWVWALALATGVSRTTNPLLVLLVFAVLGLVVAARRGNAPWAGGFRFYFAVALGVVAVRVLFRAVFTSPAGAEDLVLFRLPQLHTPGWYAGIQIGGAVTAQAVAAAAVDGLRLACLLCCVAAANTLANPRRALRILPGALYELGVAATVALSVAPQLVESVQRVRRARRLRGGAQRGIRALRPIVIPVLHGALDGALQLAAGMDSRGYGRTGPAGRGSRRVTGVLLLAGLAGLCVGVYGLLDPTVARPVGVAGFVAGTVLCVAGLVLGGRRVARSRYRPDRWRGPEWIVAGCGLLTATVLCVHTGYDPAVLNPDVQALRLPPVPWLPATAVLVAAVAAFAAPPPPLAAAPGTPGSPGDDPAPTLRRQRCTDPAGASEPTVPEVVVPGIAVESTAGQLPGARL